MQLVFFFPVHRIRDVLGFLNILDYSGVIWKNKETGNHIKSGVFVLSCCFLFIFGFLTKKERYMNVNKIFGIVGVGILCACVSPVSGQKNVSGNPVDGQNILSGIEAIGQDRKIPVGEGKCSNFQPGSDISASFDGKKETIYHSNWTNGGDDYFPIELEYTFDDVDNIDYLVYYPRPDGQANGYFGKFNVSVKCGGDKEFKPYGGEFDFKMVGGPERIDFPGGLKKPKAVKFTVLSGASNYATCAEMEFYARDKKAFDVTTVFTDATCSALKEGVTRKQVDKIKHPFYRSLADAMLRGTYPTDLRSREYKAYLHPHDVSRMLKTNPFDLLDNATGISVNKGDDLVVMLGATGGQKIGLRLMKWQRGYSGTDFMLAEGTNKITMPDSGLLYVNYFAENYRDLKPVRVHFASGDVNGVFDITRHNNADWKNLLANAKNDYVDVLGKYAHVVFRVEDFKKYCPEDGVRFTEVYDSIVSVEQELMGLHKYNRLVPNRILYQAVDHSYMYATSYRTAYHVNTMSGIIPPKSARGHWGLFHEVGHMHQTRPGFKWIGMTEVSNNLYSLHAQQVFGFPSRLLEGAYLNAYNQIIVPRADHASHGPFEKLVPLWQLQLYMAKVKGVPDFYMDIHEKVRQDKDPASNGEAQLNFVKMCCDLAKTDFTDFFSAWGFLTPIDKMVNDYSTQLLKCTEEDITAVKEYIRAKGYQKPLAIEFLRDDNIALYKNSLPVVANVVTLLVDGKIIQTGCANVVAYELYRLDEKQDLVLNRIEIGDSFPVKDWKAGDVLKAVAADGTRVVVDVTPATSVELDD